MYVIYKIVRGFTYYARITNGKIVWEGLTDNATKWSDKQIASIKAEYYNLNPGQIKKL